MAIILLNKMSQNGNLFAKKAGSPIFTKRHKKTPATFAAGVGCNVLFNFPGF